MIEYRIESSLHLMQAHITGSVHFLDLVNFVTRLRKDPQWGPAVGSLLLIEEAAVVDKVEPGSLRSLFHKIGEEGGSGRWAIVSTNKDHTLRFHGAVEGFHSAGLQIRVFEDELLALGWLRSDQKTTASMAG